MKSLSRVCGSHKIRLILYIEKLHQKLGETVDYLELASMSRAELKQVRDQAYSKLGNGGYGVKGLKVIHNEL